METLLDVSSGERRELLQRLLEERVGALRYFPLSLTQERLWQLNKLQPENANYNNVARAFVLVGRLNVTALEQAIAEVVQRHDALRTSFMMISERPTQVVAPKATCAFVVTDLRDVPASKQEPSLRTWKLEEAGRPFDLAKAPMVRFNLCQLSAEKHELLIVMHHIVFDGWSMGVLYREIGLLYEAFADGRPSPLPELPIQYPDYAVWQRERLQGSVLERLLTFWKSELASAPSVIEFPTNHPRPPVPTFAGAWHHLGLSPSEIEELTSFSARQSVTLFMTLFAAFSVLVHRYTGQDDLVVGTPFANRSQPETEGLIGLFVNNLVVRVKLTGNPTFRQLLARVRKAALEAYDHQEVTAMQLIEALQADQERKNDPLGRTTGADLARHRGRLFQVMFVLPPAQPFDLPGLAAYQTQVDFVVAPVELTLSMLHTPAGVGTFIYNKALFAEATIARLGREYRALLRALLADPEEATPPASVPIV